MGKPDLSSLKSLYGAQIGQALLEWWSGRAALDRRKAIKAKRRAKNRVARETRQGQRKERG